MIENAGHDLSLFFNPESIAVVGVSTKKTFTFGGMSFVTRLIESGYKGRLYPINPNAEAFLGIKAYPDLASLPEVPDLAIVCLQAPHVPSVLEDCARAGIKHIHILSAGFRETGDPERIAIEEQVVLIAAKEGLLIMGPNCMGPVQSVLRAYGLGSHSRPRRDPGDHLTERGHHPEAFGNRRFHGYRRSQGR